MHKEIHDIRTTKQKNLFTVALNFSAYTLLHHVVQCIFFWHRLVDTKKKVYKWNKKGKLKYTSNMRSQNEVIQVRSVEIKLKVNSNNNNNNRRRRRERDEAQGQKNTEKEPIYSVVLLVAPKKSCWAVSRPISDFPPFPSAIWICDRPP